MQKENDPIKAKIKIPNIIILHKFLIIISSVNRFKKHVTTQKLNLFILVSSIYILNYIYL